MCMGHYTRSLELRQELQRRMDAADEAPPPLSAAWAFRQDSQ